MIYKKENPASGLKRYDFGQRVDDFLGWYPVMNRCPDGDYVKYRSAAKKIDLLYKDLSEALIALDAACDAFCVLENSEQIAAKRRMEEILAKHMGYGK